MEDYEQRKIYFKLDDLEYQIGSLRIDVDQLKKIDTSTGGIDTTALDEIDNKITTNAGNITLLRNSITANAGNIQNIQNELEEIETNITSIQTTLQTIKNYDDDIISLQTKIGNTQNLSTQQKNLTGAINELKNNLSSKQNSLTAGTGITISNSNVISSNVDLSSKQDVLTAGNGIDITNNVVSSTIDLSGKQDTLETGENILIENNTISADLSGKQDTLTAGDNITIEDGVISANIDLSSKQDVLTAGTGITIENNVISATGTSGSSGGGLSPEQETLLNNLQTSINTLSSMINDRNAIFNTPYNSIEQTDLIQTYDSTDKQYNYYGKSTYNSAPFVFYVDPTSTTAKLKISLMIKGDNNGEGRISIYHNSNALKASDNFTYDSNLQIKEFIFDLDITGSSNYIYFTVTTTNQTNLSFEYAKLELYNCKNPIFLTKLKKYDVTYFNNKYYITNCTGKTAKYCIIDVNEITTANDITWIDTGIEAQYMTFCGKFTTNNSVSTVQNSDITMCFLLQNCYLYFENLSDNTKKLNYTSYLFGSASPSNPYTYGAYLFCNLLNNNNVLSIHKAICSTSYTSTYSTISNNGSVAKTEGLRVNNINYFNNNYNFIANQNTDGTVTFKYGSKYEVNLGFGTVLNCYALDTPYKQFNVYVNVFGRVVKHQILQSGSTMSLVSSNVVGNYDDYFEGINNDYFVVKNNKLYYYKSELQNIN